MHPRIGFRTHTPHHAHSHATRTATRLAGFVPNNTRPRHYTPPGGQNPTRMQVAVAHAPTSTQRKRKRALARAHGHGHCAAGTRMPSGGCAHLHTSTVLPNLAYILFVQCHTHGCRALRDIFIHKCFCSVFLMAKGATKLHWIGLIHCVLGLHALCLQ